MRRLPPMNALRGFEAAARHGSFHRAAEELHVTPSAISHQIKTLEGYLGLTLFERVGRRVQLSSAGAKYLESIGRAFDEIDIASKRLMAAPNADTINISVSPAFLTRWLVPRIREFQERYPDIELRLSACGGPIDFARTDIDMAIYFGTGDWDNVECQFLRPVVLVPVCSPRLLTEGTGREKPFDLTEQTLIDVSSRPTEWDEVLTHAGLRRPKAGKRISFSNTSLAIAAAMNDSGIALADRLLVSRELVYGQLVIPSPLEFDVRKGFYLVHQKRRPLTRGMKVFRDWLLAEISGEQPPQS